jgi:hypothetical protein
MEPTKSGFLHATPDPELVVPSKLRAGSRLRFLVGLRWKRLGILCSFLIFSTSAMAQGVTPSIGFVYQVPGFNEVYDAADYQYPFVNRQIYRDFAVMSSLGVGVIKIPISISAVIDPGSAANNNWANQRIHINSSQFAMAQQAVPSIIKMAASFGMKSVVDFTLSALYVEGWATLGSSPTIGFWPNLPNGDWFQFLYDFRGIPEGGSGVNVASWDMVTDVVTWENQMISAIVNAGADSNVLYYNLTSETPYVHIDSTWQMISYQLLYSLVHNISGVSAGKRAADAYVGMWSQPMTGVNGEPDTFAANRLAMSASSLNWPLAMTEYHAYYPDPTVLGSNSPAFAQSDIVSAVSQIGSIFSSYGSSGSVAVGEAGASYCGLNADPSQQDSVLSAIVAGVIQSQSPYMFNWGLWDSDPNTACGNGSDGHRFGIGFSSEKPRHAYGSWVERQSDLKGGDFESGLGQWSIGTNGTPFSVRQLWMQGVGSGGAATHSHYQRIEMTSPNIAAWTCSPAFNANGSELAVSAFVRTNNLWYEVLVGYMDSLGWNFNTGRPFLSKSVFTDADSIAGSLNSFIPPSQPGFSGSTWSFFQFLSLYTGANSNNSALFHLSPGVTQLMVCLLTGTPTWSSASNPGYLDLDSVSASSWDPGSFP